MEQIYERFFSTTHLSTQVMETGSRIAHEIADALDALKKAGATTERYGATLNVAADSLLQHRHRWRCAEAPDQRARLGHHRDVEAELQPVAQAGAVLQEMEKLRTSLRQARAEALTDALTGIANRKLFDETLRLRKEEADAEKTELSLMLCDIDHFKSFNDTWGHQTGDQVIRFVASALTKFALPDHLVARYGGEEFAVIMPRTSLQGSRPHRRPDPQRHRSQAPRSPLDQRNHRRGHRLVRRRPLRVGRDGRPDHRARGRMPLPVQAQWP